MTPFVGTIFAFAFPFAPKGWSQCNGQLLAISTNQALFALLGVQYGGDGRTTFGLPDLRGRAAISQGILPGTSTHYVMGQPSGTENVTLVTANLPVHSHSVTVAAASGVTPLGITLNAANVAGAGTASPAGSLLATAHSTGTAIYAAGSSTPVVAMAPSAISLTNGGGGLPAIGIGPNGSSTPVSILQPYLAVNYCIALQGYFPSRN
jgi:microcystin-dependent protein